MQKEVFDCKENKEMCVNEAVDGLEGQRPIHSVSSCLILFFFLIFILLDKSQQQPI